MPHRAPTASASLLAASALLGVAALGPLGCASNHTPATSAAGVQIQQLPDRLRVTIDGSLFTEYRFQDTSRPFLYPILAPDGTPVSRRWPIEPGEAEEQDHPHHRSLWFAHGDVNEVDFWSESAKAGRTLHQEVLEASSGRNTGSIRTRNLLTARDGTAIGTEEFALRFHRRPGIRLFDFDVTLRASHGDLTLGDTKEGAMAIRLAESMRLAPNKHNTGKPGGHIVNSEGVRDAATWGKRAAWVDYFGPVGGKTVGVAILDHPGNPRHPTWWHVRDYGLFAANPFGIHDFEKKPAGTGNLKIAAGQSVTFRYRFVVHPGNEQDGRIADLFAEYAGAR